MLGTKVYVELDEELCLERRIERDMRERGRSRESVIRQFEATVAPMARQYVYPTRAHADLLIFGNTAGPQLAAHGLAEHGLAGDSEFSRQVAVLCHVLLHRQGGSGTAASGGGKVMPTSD